MQGPISTKDRVLIIKLYLSYSKVVTKWINGNLVGISELEATVHGGSSECRSRFHRKYARRRAVPRGDDITGVAQLNGAIARAA
jgi:hypothetical protein